ncbi:MAG: hypothetical protein ACRD0A_06070 [Acidimicrobiales bacterium]
MTNESIPGWPSAGLPAPKDDDTGPSLTTWLLGGAAVLVGALVLFGVIVPAVFSVLWLLLPVLMVVIGVTTVSRGRAASPLARLAGWAAIGLGALWFVSAIDLGRLLFVGLLLGAGIFIGRRMIARRG